MSNVNKVDVVDVDALQFDDDIEEIVISDYSGEEDEVNAENLEYSSQNISGSELKISSVVSCSELAFSGKCSEELDPKTTNENDILNQASDSELAISSVVGDDSSCESNFSYDSLTDDDVQGDSRHAALERQRRNALRGLYQDLWESISSEPLHPTCSKRELLTTTYDMIRKLTVAGRKLQYSAELCLQSNYRLKRKLKRMAKKKRKQSIDSRDGPKPGKVVTSRASI